MKTAYGLAMEASNGCSQGFDHQTMKDVHLRFCRVCDAFHVQVENWKDAERKSLVEFCAEEQRRQKTCQKSAISCEGKHTWMRC